MEEYPDILELEDRQIGVLIIVSRHGRSMKMNIAGSLVVFPGDEQLIPMVEETAQMSGGKIVSRRLEVLNPGESCTVRTHGWVLHHREAIANREGDAIRRRILPTPLKWFMKAPEKVEVANQEQ